MVTTLDELEVRTPDSFLRLVATAGRSGARLIVDISPHFELGSAPRVDGVLQSLAEAPLPEHVAILCGLVKNRVYGDLEVCFLYSESAPLLEALTNAAEVTWSRTPILSQDYYDTILRDLLSFRLDPHGPAGRPEPRRPRTRSELEEQRRTLRDRAERLGQVLSESGWDPLPPRGGLFLVARPPAGLDAETAADVLFQSTGILVNGSVWTGIPGHCRFVTAVEEKDFEAALERLRGWRLA